MRLEIALVAARYYWDITTGEYIPGSDEAMETKHKGRPI